MGRSGGAWFILYVYLQLEVAIDEVGAGGHQKVAGGQGKEEGEEQHSAGDWHGAHNEWRQVAGDLSIWFIPRTDKSWSTPLHQPL